MHTARRNHSTKWIRFLETKKSGRIIMHRQSMLPSVPGTATNKLGAEICVQLFDKENVGSRLFAPQPVEIGALAHTLHMYSQIIARQHKIKTTTAGQASEPTSTTRAPLWVLQEM
jgi:hypothetical protein